MKCLAQVSGGLDSAASLLWALREEEFEEVVPVFYEYGQIYEERELKAAMLLTGRLSCNYHHLKLLEVVKIPMQKTMPGAIKEYTPFRNLVLMGHSVNFAAALGCGAIVVGSKSVVHRRGDPYSFHDSTLPFYRYLADAIKEGTEEGSPVIDIRMPLCGWDKVEVLKYLIVLGQIPQNLWTCYTAGPRPCGECYHCLEYRKGMEDPEVQKAMARAIK